MIAFRFPARRDTLGNGDVLVPKAACGSAHLGLRRPVSLAANCSDYLEGGEVTEGARRGHPRTVPPARCVHAWDLALRRLLRQRCTTPTHPTPPPSPLPHPGLPAPPPRFAGFGEGVRGVEVGACAKGWKTGRPGGMTARGTTAEGGRGRKLGETVQAKMGVGKEGGAAARAWDTAGERKGGGGERAGAAGWFPLVRAGCRETRGPMSAHQLSLAPSACPYMVRPLRGRPRSSPYKGRNLNTGYTLFSARGRGPRSMGAPPSGLRRAGPGAAGRGRGGRAAGPDVAAPPQPAPAVAL